MMMDDDWIEFVQVWRMLTHMTFERVQDSENKSYGASRREHLGHPTKLGWVSPLFK